MPKRTDIKTIMILGAGPIIIGQACEFDYSGAQACKALKEEGYRVVLVNSNPATIMTDPVMADATYIEPLNWKVLERIIAKEKPDAILPTMGGQTALNLAMDLNREGILEKYGVELIGAKPDVIDKAEDRQRFKEAMEKIGLESARSGIAYSMAEALEVQQRVGFPAVIRPSFTLGGSGGGIAYNMQEFVEICERGLALSPTHELLIEESLLGWKEYEMEVVRDKADNCIIICSIENLDPMGIHTGDSITVAPAQTLTDREYQLLRDASIAVLREIGVDTGGSNVQFAVNPKNGRLIVIEMNPRVSRSSALASKATGFPIAKIAAKLAVGYTLDELKNDITGGATPASFEPTIDYVVTKVPRFAFEKFPQANDRLTTQMKSVGEVMAIGSTFQESIQKALRGLETGKDGFTPISNDREEIVHEISEAGPERIFYVADAFRIGMTLDEVHQMTDIDMWFLVQIKELIDIEKRVAQVKLEDITKEEMLFLKKKGFSDKRLASVLGVKEAEVRRRRHALGVHPVYKRVDTCAAEFETRTAYMYSTYQDECEAMPTDRRKIMVLGGGPNRIGQGIEFDYCCVHAAMALREDGYETIMVNCNPETVSTDYDTSDRLYFEPVTLEDVLEICRIEKPEGVIVQYGGQTPLKICRALEAEGVRIVGTSTDAIDCAEDRERFDELLERCGIPRPEGRTVFTLDEALQAAQEVGYPVLMRPSYVLGGQNMIVAYNSADVIEYMGVITKHVDMSHPVLMDKYILGTECEVDAICDGTDYLVPGIMQQVERTGVHSGDSICVYPPYTFSQKVIDTLVDYTGRFARELKVVGLVNVQYAVQNDRVYVIEVNPRSSRTVPYISKVTGVPMVDLAVRCTLGEKLKDMGYGTGLWRNGKSPYYAVKVPVYSFLKLHGVDTMLGPEMKSTGEVLGIAPSFHEAMMKGLVAAGYQFKTPGPGSCVIISVKDSDKAEAAELAWKLHDYGYKIYGTPGTAKFLNSEMVPCSVVRQMSGARPNVIDLLESGLVDYIISTSPHGRDPHRDSVKFRRKATELSIPTITAMDTARVLVDALRGDHDISQMELVDIANLHREAAKGE